MDGVSSYGRPWHGANHVSVFVWIFAGNTSIPINSYNGSQAIVKPWPVLPVNNMKLFIERPAEICVRSKDKFVLLARSIY